MARRAGERSGEPTTGVASRQPLPADRPGRERPAISGLRRGRPGSLVDGSPAAARRAPGAGHRTSEPSPVRLRPRRPRPRAAPAAAQCPGLDDAGHGAPGHRRSFRCARELPARAPLPATARVGLPGQRLQPRRLGRRRLRAAAPGSGEGTDGARRGPPMGAHHPGRDRRPPGPRRGRRAPLPSRPRPGRPRRVSARRLRRLPCSTRTARGRPGSSWPKKTRSDALLLRLALAEARLGSPRLADHLSILEDRFTETRRRGEGMHLGAESRFRLQLLDQPVAALDLARQNWAHQPRADRRPASARGRPSARATPKAARPVLTWLEETGLEDAQLTALARQLEEMKTMRHGNPVALLLALLFALPATSFAHKPSDSYLSLRSQGGTLEGQWDIALRDLEHALGLDADRDGTITWGELRSRHKRHRRLRPCPPQRQRRGRGLRSSRPTEHLVDRHSDGAYSVLRFDPRLPALGRLAPGLPPIFRSRPLAPWPAAFRRRGRGANGGALPRRGPARPRARGHGSMAGIPHLLARGRVAHLDRLRPHPLSCSPLLLGAVLWREAGSGAR